VVFQFGAVPVLVSLLLLLAPSAAKSGLTGQLNLHNDTWDAVQVEVRVGAADSCDTNGVRTVRRGQVWAIAVDDRICWRREANPGDGSGVWTAWQSEQPADGTTIHVSL
jgi:hypothetical protein